jgi:hypothetical protein
MDVAEASNKGEDVNQAEKGSDSFVETLDVAEASNNGPHIGGNLIVIEPFYC